MVFIKDSEICKQINRNTGHLIFCYQDAYNDNEDIEDKEDDYHPDHEHDDDDNTNSEFFHDLNICLKNTK